MSVAKVIEVIASSPKGFDDAVKQGVAKANDTLSEVTAAWIKDQNVIVSAGKVVEYRVTLKVTFVLRAPRAARKKKK